MREKAQGIKLKDVKFHIFFGLKFLKNACSLPFLQRTWEMVEKYWKENDIPQNFIDTFHSEYITKPVQCSLWCKLCREKPLQ